LELTTKERNVLREEIKKRVIRGDVELPKGFTIDGMIDFLLYRNSGLVKKMQKKRDTPAWASVLMKKFDRAFEAFERYAEIEAENRKKRVAKAKRRVKFYSEEDILLEKHPGIQPFDYKQLVGKAKSEEDWQEEATEKLKTVPDLISDKEDAMKFVKDVLRLTGDLPEPEKWKKIIEAVEALERGLEKGKSVQDIKESNRRHLAEAYPEQWGEREVEPEEENDSTWLEQEMEEEDRLEEEAKEKTIQASKPDTDEDDEMPNKHTYRKHLKKG